MDSLQVHSTSASAITPDEAAVLAAYRAMDEQRRGNAVLVMQGWARRFPRERPALTLVASQGGRNG